MKSFKRFSYSLFNDSHDLNQLILSFNDINNILITVNFDLYVTLYLRLAERN